MQKRPRYQPRLWHFILVDLQEFPYTYYTQVNVTIPGQGTSTFSVNNGYAQIQMFIPMTTDKNLSVYITQQ